MTNEQTNDKVQEEECVLLNPATHKNMSDGFDMKFGVGELATDNTGFDMGMDMGLDI